MTEETKLKFFKVLGLLYGSETWIRGKIDESRIFSWNDISLNSERMHKAWVRLKSRNNMSCRLTQYNWATWETQSWVQHLNWIKSERLPKQVLNMKRDVGRPRKSCTRSLKQVKEPDFLYVDDAASVAEVKIRCNEWWLK